MNIDEKTEKRLYEEGKSDDYILGYERGEYDTEQKLKSELEIKETNIRFSNKVIEDLSIDMDYLKSELKTYKKIAEKLAVKMIYLPISEDGVFYCTKEAVIDWARKEVENEC